MKNYLFVTLKDNGNGFGDKPVGVLQLFNKLDGRPIDKDDLARAQAVSIFFGQLATKANLYATIQKSTICFLEHQWKNYNIDFDSYMFGADQGPLSQFYENTEFLRGILEEYQEM